MAILTLCLDGAREELVVEGAGSVVNAEIVSVSLPNAHPLHTTVVIRLMAPAEKTAGEKLRLAATARRVSSNLGSAECQETLATSGFDRERGRRAAEDILKQQTEKAGG